LRGSIRLWWRGQDRLSLLFLLLVFLISFGVYLYTMAPTVSFWDCGEFIACSYILGIPHPPGTPLFILIGRLFTLVPLFGEVAARVNFISVLFSALTVGLSYLVILRLVRLWSGEGIWGRLSGYVGGVVGSLFLAFSMTFWGNGVEAEVYGMCMFLMLLLVYLSLLWIERRGSVMGDRMLVLMAYLAFLSIGVHMTAFLVVPVIFLLVVFLDRGKLRDFRFWVAGLVLGLVMVTLEPFLILAGIWLVLGLVVLSVRLDHRWVLSFMLVLVALVGFSSHLYIPIRSGLDPAIDENNPSDWVSFKYFLERKQYGQESMVERMFYRRGSLGNQFGVHPRMGFWGFFREQYTQRSLWFLPVLLGGFGLWSGIRRRRKEGLFLLLIFLISSVGLVMYMNFADGTRPDPITGEIIRLEVRDRDYFFTPAFMFFAILLGLGAAGLLRSIGEVVEKYKSNHTFLRFTGYLVLVFLLFLPLLTFSKNFNSPNNRRGNYLPWDYAYNLLNSCAQDAILFTNGDNDTFPLWFIQEVEGVRKDVRVVNLSLLNTHWYILQLKNRMGVPVSFSDKEIERLIPMRTQDGRVFRVQDIMINDILDANKWKQPIYFATTVSPDNKIYKGELLDEHLKMEGMAYRVVREKGRYLVDVEKMEKKLFEEFKFRAISDPNVKKNENDLRLLANYSSSFLTLADTLRRAGEYQRAEEVGLMNLGMLPWDWRPYGFLVQLYGEMGELDKAEELMEKNEILETDKKDYIYMSLAQLYRSQGEQDKSVELMNRLLEGDPPFKPALQFLLSHYYEKKDREQLIFLLERWIARNPNDNNAISALNQMKSPDFKFPSSESTGQNP